MSNKNQKKPDSTALRQHLKNLGYIERISLVLVVAALVGVGAHFIQGSSAATPFITAETENGTVVSPATIVTDSAAASSTAVKFSAATPPPADGGCVFNGVPAPCFADPGASASGYGVPVFSDDFGGTSLDLNKWAPCWYPDSFTGNRCGKMNESTTDKTNVTVSGGFAILTQAARDSGALINSDLRAGAKTGFMMNSSGYAEARVFFPGSGPTIYNWPAFWINGPESGYSDGEIDVAEGLGEMTTNYHYDNGGGHVANNQEVNGTWSNGWHTYGVARQAGQNIVYFDGREVRRYTTYDNFAPESLIFNVGTKESRTMVYGTNSQVKIDYVRVWKK